MYKYRKKPIMNLKKKNALNFAAKQLELSMEQTNKRIEAA